MNEREFLSRSLVQRTPTVPVARAVRGLVAADPRLPDATRVELARLASSRHYSYGTDDFDRPVPADRQFAVADRLFPGVSTAGDPADPEAVRRLVDACLEALGGFVHDAPGRVTATECLTARAWSTAAERKRLRFLRRLEEKADRLDDQWRLRGAQMRAKSRLAYIVNTDACDDLTLSFVAYLAARANRRSMFTLGPQSRARDTIVDGLAEALRANPTTAWAQVALVSPTPDVLERCTQEERGVLIANFHAAMADAAEALRDLWPGLPERMRAEMVMVRGVDSSRWNAYAGALNTMRSAWLNASLASGLDPRDGYLPGKAPRLMASDLAWWYRNTGQDLHEDTTLFSALPRPWEVVLGEARLDRETIERKAHELGVDVSTGWTGPRRGEEPEAPAPEPALVHGIAVADPRLADTLRRCGVFSGKDLRHPDELPDALERVEVDDGRRVTQPVVGATELSQHPRG